MSHQVAHHPNADDAQIATADWLEVGDLVYVANGWLGESKENSQRFRRIVEIIEGFEHKDPDGTPLRYVKFEMLSDSEPRNLSSCYRPGDLVIIPANQE